MHFRVPGVLGKTRQEEGEEVKKWWFKGLPKACVTRYKGWALVKACVECVKLEEVGCRNPKMSK